MGSHTSLHDAGNRRRHLRGYHHGPGENRRPVNRLNTQPENNLHHALGHYRWKDRKAVAKDLKLIYQAVDDGEAAKALDDFEAEWGDKYPSIAPSWRRAWQEVIPFFAFPPAVRKIIYTTNAIESLNRVIRKTTKTRGSFPTDAAATKLIYLAIRNFEKAGRCVREWVAARNQFAILYPERFNK